MLYNNKISKAISFSIKTHEVYQKQKRKGKDIPYIVHPLTVGIILSRACADENTVVAGILHDTIEDSVPEKKVSQKMLRERFGTEVAKLVQSVSETKELSWEDRKKEIVERIKTFTHNSLLIKSADLISNITEIVDDYEHSSEAVFKNFGAPKEKLIQNYLRTISAVTTKWPANPLTKDLELISKKLQFILNIK